MNKNNIQFGREQTHQGYSATQAYGKAHGSESYFYVICSTKVYRYERQPYNARGIHCKSYVF